MRFVTEVANSFSTSQESFGIACFAKDYGMEYAQSYRLLSKDDSCYGSVCLVCKIKDVTLVACRFPFDLRIEDNNTVRAMSSLIEFADSFKEKVFAFGDMNTIDGSVRDQIEYLLFPTLWKLTDDQYTFFAGYYGHVSDSIVLEEIVV